MRICLIRCPSPFLIDERVFPPLGLMSVGTALKEQGHNVMIYDGEMDGIPMDCDGYGFGPTTPEYSYAVKAKNIIQKKNQKAKVIIGGSFATLNPKQCTFDGFRSVVQGDGEIGAGKAFSDGYSFIRESERSLDEYQMIDRSILDLGRYKYFLNGKKTTTMMTSQGCPFKCAFCSKTYYTVRFRSIPNVIREIEYLHFDLKYDGIAFIEDIFILQKERVEKISHYLKGWNITWRCLVRADLIVRYGDEFCKMMADSGCIEVGMGIESGSDKILKIINKGETIKTIKTAVKMLKNAGISVKGFFIVGLPGESHETLKETREFLDDAMLNDVDVKIYQPYPGSPIWNNKRFFDIQWHNGIDFSQMFYKGKPGEYYGNISTSSLTTEEIYEEWVDMENIYKWHKSSA